MRSLFVNKRDGFAVMAALVVATLMLILAVSLFSFAGHQHAGVRAILNGEIAHILAEAGIDSSVGVVRQAVSAGLADETSQRRLMEMLTQAGQLEDVEVTNLFDGTWNNQLAEFSSEVGPSASINVQIWLRDFQFNETDPSFWADPVSKEGFLTIESTGAFENIQRTIVISRRVKISSALPGPLSKFSLFVKDAAKDSAGAFNLIRNDYRGMLTDGPLPLIILNHSAPSTPFNPVPVSDVISAQSQPDVYKRRGWIWLGGGNVRLNLSSGAGDHGEIFHFYDVSSPNEFSPVRFYSDESSLPSRLQRTLRFPWDKTSQGIREGSYNFRHSFILDGFHDRSDRQNSDAMYEADILSDTEKAKYSSRSSVLRLFGKAREGYQSRTKVFGNVDAAFARFATLDVTAVENDIQTRMSQNNPPPLYLLPSLTRQAYDETHQIRDFLGRQTGGPLLQTGLLFDSYSDYSQVMSRIITAPYAFSYNNMQEVYEAKDERTFPAANRILSSDSGDDLLLRRDEHTFFEGRPSIRDVSRLMDSRADFSIDTIPQFWQQYLNENNELVLDKIIRIRNPQRQDLIIPPPGIQAPIIVKKGGAIVLEQGNLRLGGIEVSDPEEALTILVSNGQSITFTSTRPNYVNVVAPHAQLEYSSRFELFGTLAVNSIHADHRFQGGILRWRETQDPLLPYYDNYYKIFIDPRDTYWNE